MKTQKNILSTIIALLVMSIIIFTGCPQSTGGSSTPAPTESFIKMTFSDETVGEKKPNLTFTPTTLKAISSISFDIYIPEDTSDAGVTGGKAYFKTGTDWDWNQGEWTDITKDSWVTLTATYENDDVFQAGGFSGYIKSQTGVENLVLYFDNFTVTYQDGTSDSFDFSDGSTTGFEATSDTGGTGSLEISTTVSN